MTVSRLYVYRCSLCQGLFGRTLKEGGTMSEVKAPCPLCSKQAVLQPVLPNDHNVFMIEH